MRGIIEYKKITVKDGKHNNSKGEDNGNDRN